jgi:RNA polymerase sigma-70 factor (family 1)
MAKSTLTDEQLIELLRTEGDFALRVLYERYVKKLYSLAFYKTKSREAAEEIVQEVFIKLWEKRDSQQIEHLESYLFTALKYQIINYLRKIISEKKTSSVQNDLILATAPDHSLSVEEIKTTMEQSILQLPEKTRQIFVLSRYDQQSHREIAERLDLSEKSVEYHITQALKHLRVELKDYLPLVFVLWQC